MVIRQHGMRVAILTGLGAQARREASLRAIGGPSKLPRVHDTGRVEPVSIRRRLNRSPSQELSEERD